MHNGDLSIPDRGSVLAAEAAIRPHIRRTPVIEVGAKDFGLTGPPLTFKLEFMQHSGTFKARGAFVNLLMREAAVGGVVAASGGNHGAAVAFAARRLGIKAWVFVPTISAPAKIERIRAYDAEIVVGGESYADAFAAAAAFARERGLPMAHAYDGFETLAGQGTVALELREQAPEVETLLVAVGGGGLIGGMAAYLRGDVALVGVETEGCPALSHALVAGGPVNAPVGGIAADSLGARRIGDVVFPLAHKYVRRAVLVSDAAVVEAQRSLWDVLRVVVEPGGAAAFAALLSGRYAPEAGERVGVVLCGANTDHVFHGT